MDAAKELELFKAQLQEAMEVWKANLANSMEVWKEKAIRERRAWEQTLDWEMASFRGVLDFALVAIRSLILINGGAVVAILAFLSSIWKSTAEGGTPVIARAMASPLGYFIAGLVAAMMTAMLSYLAQVAFTEFRKEKDGKVRNPVGAPLRIFAILSAAASLGLFSYGAWRAVEAFAANAP